MDGHVDLVGDPITGELGFYRPAKLGLRRINRLDRKLRRLNVLLCDPGVRKRRYDIRHQFRVAIARLFNGFGFARDAASDAGIVRRHGDAAFADDDYPRLRRRSRFRSLRLSRGNGKHRGD